jgi:hypothetical protein
MLAERIPFIVFTRIVLDAIEAVPMVPPAI